MFGLLLLAGPIAMKVELTSHGSLRRTTGYYPLLRREEFRQSEISEIWICEDSWKGSNYFVLGFTVLRNGRRIHLERVSEVEYDKIRSRGEALARAVGTPISVPSSVSQVDRDWSATRKLRSRLSLAGLYLGLASLCAAGFVYVSHQNPEMPLHAWINSWWDRPYGKGTVGESVFGVLLAAGLGLSMMGIGRYMSLRR